MNRHARLILSATVILLTSTSLLPAQFAHDAADVAVAGSEPSWTPTVVDDTLDNGLRILFTHVNDIPLAEISVLVDAGMMRDPADKPGLAYLTSQMLLRGSADRSREMAERRLDQLGSVMLPYVDYDYAQLYAKALSKNLPATIEILADDIIRPMFPTEPLAAFKHEASTRLASMGESFGERTTIDALHALCGPDAAVARPMLPTSDEVSALDTSDLRSFHRKWYHPGNTTIIVAGDMDYAFLRTLLLEAFGRWEPGSSAPPGRSAEPETDLSIRLIHDTATTKGLAYFRFGTTVPPRSDADFPALLVLHHVLAEADTSRLRDALWGKNVISPTFSSSLVFSRECSYMMISGSAPPAQASRILSVITGMMNDLAENGISSWELQRAQKVLLSDAPLMFASNRSLLKLLKGVVVYGLSVDDAMRLPEQIEAVTKADVKRIAARILRPQEFHISILGDAAVLQEQLEGVGRDTHVVDSVE